MNDRVIPLMDARRAAPIPAHDNIAGNAADVDLRGRRMRDLRISVTDRCNFRCTYCMPKTVFGRDYPFLPRDELLSFEEIARVARIFVANGVNKIRLTGGEPLLRRHIEHLIEMLAVIPGLDLTLTTNGSLLARKARSLRDAGLQRVTVSLDALDDPTFRKMNDVDFPVAQVLEGIAAAEAAGLAPIKINMVVKRGLNDHAILPMARYFRATNSSPGHIVRFIEYMDVGSSNGWKLDEVVPSAEVVQLISAEQPLIAVDPNYPGEVAERWRYRDGGGEIGVISSVTQAFCATCTRARLSTDGALYTCLFAQRGHDLRGLLRGGQSDQAIGAALAALWSVRDDNYSEIRTAQTTSLRAALKKIEMSYIGG
ncbi:MAG: GTP 3',8-cyclase MoaA [Betaproteobacteria bacterium]|nr:GTP 3',8-cyclase MoaA [Betaproteobacteria bacterium]